MKRAFILLLILALVLTGCAKEKIEDLSVKDVCCPYKIEHKEGALKITLQDAEKSGLLWEAEVMPEGICQITQEDAGKADVCQYRVTGEAEGAVQATFTALQEDGNAKFTLILLLSVDADGNVVATTYQHREREAASVKTDDLEYSWNMDVNGILNFAFFDEEAWRVETDGGEICSVRNAMSTPSGCEFSAQAKGVGTATITLVSKDTQRQVHVQIQVDENGNMKVISVQEQ